MRVIFAKRKAPYFSHPPLLIPKGSFSFCKRDLGQLGVRVCVFVACEGNAHITDKHTHVLEEGGLWKGGDSSSRQGPVSQAPSTEVGRHRGTVSDRQSRPPSRPSIIRVLFSQDYYTCRTRRAFPQGDRCPRVCTKRREKERDIHIHGRGA